MQKKPTVVKLDYGGLLANDSNFNKNPSGVQLSRKGCAVYLRVCIVSRSESSFRAKVISPLFAQPLRHPQLNAPQYTH